VEKRSPHYDLARVQADVALGGGGLHQNRLGRRSKHGTDNGGDAGGDRFAFAPRFYKSMTTFNDHRLWQDVYLAATPVRTYAYIKITLRDAAPVIQFKEK
jgi:motility quorum-sensing regulator / GCU-specific mRNA interferase toxin